MAPNDQDPGAPLTDWETSVGRMTMRPDGIAFFESHPGAEERLSGAREVVEGYRKLGGGRRLLAVADIRRARSVDREARRYYAGEEMGAVVQGLALVVDSGISRVLGNFFLSLNRPRFEMRLVRSSDEGVKWLQTLPSDHQS